MGIGMFIFIGMPMAPMGAFLSISICWMKSCSIFDAGSAA
nr:hypothetical protein [uncultured organism]